MPKHILALVITSLSASLAAADSFYTEPALFSTRPDAKKSSTPIHRFGPVGISLDLIQPAFTIRILGVEPGSPAAAAGLAPGQIIESINGEKLAAIDPRIQLGGMITAAEATDGIMKMVVADKPGGTSREIVVTIPVLGAYAETWPLKCPKSETIVRNFATYLKKPGANKGFADIGMLFLLSTGDASDLEFVGQWARRKTEIPSIPWHLGYGSLALCEYYLRTGDPAVLPIIQARADKLVAMENNGGWGSREAICALTYGGGGGHLNAAGVLCAATLLLAKECGANVPDDTLLRVLAHFYRFAGRGIVAYGNNKPEGGFTDNGKNGKNAFVMAAAAALTPDGEASLYARARDTAAQSAFYSTGYMLHGHTGGGIGEIWRSASMGLLHDKMPHHYRDFMNKRAWHYELSRRHDGSFGILGGERYDTPEWGAGYALTYTIPRKTLRLTGAPPTAYSKRFQLPERPWGTAEDDDFESIEPAKLPDGTLPDLSSETIADSTGFALISAKRSPLKFDQARLLHYLCHPNSTVRTIYLAEIAKQPPEFLDALLVHDDARVRRTALEFLGTSAAGTEPLNASRLERIRAMLADPGESWFVKDMALTLLAKAPAEWVIDQLDLLLPFLDHEEWWLRQSTLVAVTPVVADERAYRKVIPAIGTLMRTNHIFNITGPIRWGAMPSNIRKASPAVQALARQEFQEAYATYVGFDHPLEAVNKTVDPTMREFLAEALANVPGGFDALYQVSKAKSPTATLPYQKLFLQADPATFSAELRAEVDALIKSQLIPRYVGENREYLLKEQANEPIAISFSYREPRVLGLAALYRRIGNDAYEWHDFGPGPTAIPWHYFSFDPPEELAWDTGKTRYREITFPKGLEHWFEPSFDPARAGWKTGFAPFGATNGLLVTKESTCPYDFCRHGVPMRTLWEKEVLLLRGKPQFPALEDGYRHRLLVGGMSHVGAGEGYRIYLDGKLFDERKRNIDKREGAKPIGREVDRTWWPAFKADGADVAVLGFMGGKAGYKSRQLMVWVQRMKFPPLGTAEILESVRVTPMKSAAWQALQDPDARDRDPEADRFLWDGIFRSNPAFTGTWKTVGFVSSPDAFDAAKPKEPQRAPLQAIRFESDGATQDPLWIWSGSTLMNLRKNEALAMSVAKRGDTDYLFVEAGGFDVKHGNDWKSPWFVMKREP